MRDTGWDRRIRITGRERWRGKRQTERKKQKGKKNKLRHKTTEALILNLEYCETNHPMTKPYIFYFKYVTQKDSYMH